jgi:hypothetical protein
VLGFRRRRARERLQVDVEVLDQEVAAGTQRGRHPTQRLTPVGDVREHEPRVDEVEAALRRVVLRDVVTAHLHPGRCHAVDPGRVDVGREDEPVRPGLLRQPRRHGRPTRADLPAAPSRADAERDDVPARHIVEERRERVEPGGRLTLPVVEEIRIGLSRRYGSVALPRVCSSWQVPRVHAAAYPPSTGTKNRLSRPTSPCAGVSCIGARLAAAPVRA